MIDPPKFGRGPDGEVWKLDESLPDLLRQCRLLLSDRPLFVILSCYAIRASALSLYYALEEMLAQLGYEPVGFDDSRAALAAIRADPRRFDAVVSDEVMPELVGTQLAIEMRKLNPSIPIVIASGYGGAGFEARALAAGVNRVLRKPYRMGEVAEALATLLAKPGA